MADELLDDLMPPEFEWRAIVRRHPIPTLVVAAAAGFFLGRSRRSAAVVDALAGAVATGLVAEVGAQLGGLSGPDSDYADHADHDNYDVRDDGFV